MSEKKGSSTAIALIKKLKSSGHLIDVYDFDRVNSDKSDDAPFSTSDLEGFDEDYGLDYRNHLLAIFIDEDLDVRELINLYPPFSSHFDSVAFTPHLIFINLKSQSILVVKLIGRGRVGSFLLPHTDADFDKFQELD